MAHSFQLAENSLWIVCWRLFSTGAAWRRSLWCEKVCRKEGIQWKRSIFTSFNAFILVFFDGVLCVWGCAGKNTTFLYSKEKKNPFINHWIAFKKNAAKLFLSVALVNLHGDLCACKHYIYRCEFQQFTGTDNREGETESGSKRGGLDQGENKGEGQTETRTCGRYSDCQGNTTALIERNVTFIWQNQLKTIKNNEDWGHDTEAKRETPQNGTRLNDSCKQWASPLVDFMSTAVCWTHAFNSYKTHFLTGGPVWL